MCRNLMLSFFSSLILAFSYAHVKNNSSGFFFSIFMSLSFINFIFLAFPPGSFFVMPPCFYTISQSHQLLPLLCDSSIICSQFGLCLLVLCTIFLYTLSICQIAPAFSFSLYCHCLSWLLFPWISFFPPLWPLFMPSLPTVLPSSSSLSVSVY